MTKQCHCPFCNWPESDKGFNSTRMRYECPNCGGAGPRDVSKTAALISWRRRPIETDLEYRIISAQAEMALRSMPADEVKPLL